MLARRLVLGLAASAAAISLEHQTWAAITSLEGSTTVEIQQFVADLAGDSDEARDEFPGTSTTLPLQVVTRLLTEDQQAGGAVAAQLADPLTAGGTNPEDFALNLALDSLAPQTHYAARASVREVRHVLFSPSEVGDVPAGQTIRLRGRLFLDGALAVFAIAEARDLTGVSITLRVTVVQEVPDLEPQQLFAGALVVTGDADRQITVVADGDLPTRGILDADLSDLDPQLGVFRAFVLPNIILEYPYEATVGQEFTLRATIEVEAANQPGGIGVATILGTPLDTLTELITLTRSAATAKTMNTALLDERAHPTGRPAFPQPRPLFPACGLFGVESALGMLGVISLRRARFPGCHFTSRRNDRRDADAPLNPEP